MSNTLLDSHLKIFQEKFKKDFSSKIPLLDIVLKYIIKSKGKQLRPRFVLASAALFGNIDDKVYRAASLIELLHTATLVHDDVVDDAELRRGRFSINALWKNKIAVLVGDYLLSKGLLLSLDHDDFEVLKIVSNAVKMMSEGEMLQIEKARRLDIQEDIYFEIIKAKTASLLSAACAAGAFASTQDKQKADIMGTFGTFLGIAFQIKDDLLDYGQDDIGKPKGIDIKEKKMTLPLIYTLNNVSSKEKKEIIYLIKNKSKDKKSIDYIINKVINTGGITYAEKIMYQYYDKAIEVLEPYAPHPAYDYLLMLADKSVNRKK